MPVHLDFGAITYQSLYYHYQSLFSITKACLDLPYFIGPAKIEFKHSWVCFSYFKRDFIFTHSICALEAINNHIQCHHKSWIVTLICVSRKRQVRECFPQTWLTSFITFSQKLAKVTSDSCVNFVFCT